jgi:hypothetical protein
MARKGLNSTPNVERLESEMFKGELVSVILLTEQLIFGESGVCVLMPL